MKRTNRCAVVAGAISLAIMAMTGDLLAAPLKPIEELGKYVFFDNISIPKRMSCSSCHDPSAGWTFKDSGVNLHQVAVTGADPHTAGSVKPPTNAYATFIKPFSACTVAPAGFCGGNFWNGRSEGNIDPVFPATATQHIGDQVFIDKATGETNTYLKAAYQRYLGPVADQALNPFPNPVEQNIEREGVCKHVKSATYAELFTMAWGEPLDCSGAELDKNYQRIAVALAAWQASDEVNSFSSKRDIALRGEKDGQFPLAGLTDQENYGHDLFYANRFRPLIVKGVTKFANCGFCHSDNPNSDTGAEPLQLYSDDSHHNIGTPGNPEIPTSSDPNEGLAGHTGNPLNRGVFKTPTLRNVDKRPGVGFIKGYTHNGWFKSLESIVHFYNTADVTFPANGKTRCPDSVTTEKDAMKQHCWPAPAYENFSAIPFLVGRLELTPEDEAAIVAYLKTFTDTKTPKPPPPYKQAAKK